MTVFLWQKIVVIASDARGSQSLIWESCESQRFDVINEKSGQVVPEPSSQWPPNPWSDATRSTSTPTVHAVIARETEQTLSCRLYIPAMTGECPLLRSLHSAVQLYPADSFRCLFAGLQVPNLSQGGEGLWGPVPLSLHHLPLHVSRLHMSRIFPQSVLPGCDHALPLHRLDKRRINALAA